MAASQPPLEKTIVSNAIKKLNAIPKCLARKFHGTPFGHPELDVYGSYKGRAFFLEAKRPGQKPTPRQQKMIDDWRKTGAISGWFDDADDAVKIVTREE